MTRYVPTRSDRSPRRRPRKALPASGSRSNRPRASSTAPASGQSRSSTSCRARRTSSTLATYLRLVTPEVPTEIGKRHGFPAFGLPEAFLNGVHRLRIGKNLRRLLQCLVLIHWDQYSGWPAPAGDDDVLSQVCHLVDYLAQLATQLSNRYRLAHTT